MAGYPCCCTVPNTCSICEGLGTLGDTLPIIFGGTWTQVSGPTCTTLNTEISGVLFELPTDGDCSYELDGVVCVALGYPAGLTIRAEVLNSPLRFVVYVDDWFGGQHTVFTVPVTGDCDAEYNKVGYDSNGTRWTVTDAEVTVNPP